MCSWCWGFASTWGKIQAHLPSTITVEAVLGGMASDSSEPMPGDIQEHIKLNWRRIEQVIPGVKFNYNFWSKCQPRRSTYPACRAVIAAKLQDKQYEQKMITAIQNAYYLEAKNPSNDDVLIGLAKSLSLHVQQFSTDLNAKNTQNILEKNINFYHQLSVECGVSGFPSLVLKVRERSYAVPRDYVDWKTTINFVKQYTQ